MKRLSLVAEMTLALLLMAIAVITTVPMALFFLVFQRYFVASNVASGIKG